MALSKKKLTNITKFIDAAKRGDTKFCKEFINAGFKINYEHYFEAIMNAIEHNQSDTAITLYSFKNYSIDKYLGSRHKNQLLAACCFYSEEKFFKYLVKKLYEADNNEYTIHQTVSSNYPAIFYCGLVANNLDYLEYLLNYPSNFKIKEKPAYKPEVTFDEAINVFKFTERNVSIPMAFFKDIIASDQNDLIKLFIKQDNTRLASFLFDDFVQNISQILSDLYLDQNLYQKTDLRDNTIKLFHEILKNELFQKKVGDIKARYGVDFMIIFYQGLYRHNNKEVVKQIIPEMAKSIDINIFLESATNRSERKIIRDILKYSPNNSIRMNLVEEISNDKKLFNTLDEEIKSMITKMIIDNSIKDIKESKSNLKRKVL